MSRNLAGISFEFDLTFEGDGSSLWGESKGTHKLISGEVTYDDEDGFCSIDLCGPETKWCHYTDNGIESDFMSKLAPIFSEKMGVKVTKITWSEQGLQPEDGWNVDVSYER